MALDLIRSVVVAAVVVALPGYLWARVLYPSVDWLETSALTVALSVTLVPASALLLAVLFGPAITLSVAMASAVVVTGLGVAIYRGWGLAPATELPPEPRVFAFGPSELVPLTALVVLLMAVDLEWVSSAVAAVYAALLVLATALLYLLRRSRYYRGDPAPDTRTAMEWNSVGPQSGGARARNRCLCCSVRTDFRSRWCCCWSWRGVTVP